MTVDISDTLAPRKSDQLDAADLLGGPRTFTVTKVTKVDGEQPLIVHLAEFTRPWKPGVTMRRVLGYCWGTDGSQWPDRRVRLFCDPDVKFGGEAVGGIRVSHLSHITRPMSVPGIIITRGRTTTYKVDVLTEETAAARDWHAEADALTDKAALGDLWREAPKDSEARTYIAARAQSLAEVES